MFTTQRLHLLVLALLALTLTMTVLHHRAHRQTPQTTTPPLPSPSEVHRALLDSDIARIAEAVATTLAAQRPPPRQSATDSSSHPLAASLGRGLRELQADLRKTPVVGPAIPSALRARWHILSPGTSRASAALVEALHRVNLGTLMVGCALTEAVTVRLRYQWVRAQYASDDHGAITAEVTTGASAEQRACLLEQLTDAAILGKRDMGQRPFALEARLTPSQEARP